MSFDGPEIHGVHRHGGLSVWVEILLSVSALVVSFASIAIALHHGQIMEKLVQANSLPYLEGGPSNATPEGEPRISYDFRNRGVGPAHEMSLKIKVGGRYVKSYRDLVTAAVGSADAPAAIPKLERFANVTRTRFISGGGQQMVFAVRLTPENALYWARLDKAMRQADYEYCYCSVFNECWTVHNDSDPVPVKQCVRDEANEFTP